jgi:hypothetical protein
MREGFEVVFGLEADGGYRVEGHCTAVEDREPWSVGYVITVDASWVTRRAEVTELSGRGAKRTVLEHAGAGHWLVDGVSAATLDGCLDADLEASAFTNALPVRRLGLAVGEAGRSAAAWVRSPRLGVERLEQSYERLPDANALHRYSYAAPQLGFTAELRYDEAGLGTDYPGLAVRVPRAPRRP